MIATKRGYEMHWKKLLSTKRLRSLMTGKRSREKKDHRTAFERDYGRALFSTPVRRLQDKTQVFPLEPNDAVRTRLTHSHEVANVAHDLARAVASFLHKKGVTYEQVDSIRTIARTCALIHDLGNPPFGHAGEGAISSWFEQKARSYFPDGEPSPDLRKSPLFKGFGAAQGYEGDFLEFEGNAQTLRLLARLQIFAHDYGMNLTCATLSAACKYVRSSKEPKKEDEHHERKKIGYFFSERDVIERLRDEVGTGDARHPITYLVEAADDIVYSSVDLEDGLRKGLYTWKQLEEWLREVGRRKGYFGDVNALLKKKNELIKDADIKGSGRWPDEVQAQAFRTAFIAMAVERAALCFEMRYDEIMAGSYHGELTSDTEFGGLVRVCKDIGREHVYNSTDTLRLEILGRTVIHDLLDLFWEADPTAKKGTFAYKLWHLLSPNYREVYRRSVEKYKLPEAYCRMQLLTDYIAGMTDTFATQLHRRLTNGGPDF